MKENLLYKKKTTHKQILSFIVPVAFFGLPTQRVNAATGDEDDWANIIAQGSAALTATATALSLAADESIWFKEYVLDPLVIILKEVLIARITESIVNWINGGFEGEPAFIEDLEGFLTNVADEIAGTYIEGTELAFLCSPFKLDLRIHIALDYYAPTRDRASCTLTGVLENLDTMFEDISSRESWNDWFQLSVNPHNNAYGAFLGSRQAMRRSIANAKGIESQILGWGDGFKSYEICDDEDEGDETSPNVSVGAGNIGINCRIATPGVVIYEQLNNVLPSGLQQLELADEFNEIIGALLGQLLKQVLGSTGGLKGLSDNEYWESTGRASNNTSEIKERTLIAIQSDLENENTYSNAKQTSRNAVRAAVEKVRALHQCYLEKASENKTLWGIVIGENGQEVVSFTTAELAAMASSASSTITSTLQPLLDNLDEDINNTNTIIEQLITIQTNVESAITVAELASAVDEYMLLTGNSTLKTIKDVSDAELERDGYPGEQHSLARGIVRDMTALITQTNADLEVCQSLVLTREPALVGGNR